MSVFNEAWHQCWRCGNISLKNYIFWLLPFLYYLFALVWFRIRVSEFQWHGIPLPKQLFWVSPAPSPQGRDQCKGKKAVILNEWTIRVIVPCLIIFDDDSRDHIQIQKSEPSLKECGAYIGLQLEKNWYWINVPHRCLLFVWFVVSSPTLARQFSWAD